MELSAGLFLDGIIVFQVKGRNICGVWRKVAASTRLTPGHYRARCSASTVTSRVSFSKSKMRYYRRTAGRGEQEHHDNSDQGRIRLHLFMVVRVASSISQFFDQGCENFQ